MDVLDEELMTAEEVATRFKVDVSWVYRAARYGVKPRGVKHKVFLPYIQVGRYPRFTESDIRAFIVKQRRNDNGRNGK